MNSNFDFYTNGGGGFRNGNGVHRNGNGVHRNGGNNGLDDDDDDGGGEKCYGRGRGCGRGRGSSGFGGGRDHEGDFESGGRRGGGRGRGRGGSDGGWDSRNSRRNDDDFDGGDQEEPNKKREFYIPPEPTNDEGEMFSSGISTGINFSKYDNIPVQINGENQPKPIKSFAEADLRDLVLENIKRSGYKVPTPIQKTAIPIIAAGRDLMACAQTGSGKTAAFLVPIINSLLADNNDMIIGRPHVLILSPTRELAIQIFTEARKFAYGSYIKVNIIYGGTSSKHQSESITKGCHILIATPGRLIDFVERTYITFEDIRFIVLDEADRMLDLGFKESIEKIMTHDTLRAITDRQTLMFSATFPREIQILAGKYLNDYIFVAIGVLGGACSDVIQNIYEVQKYQKRNKLMELLNEDASGTIVFVETKRSADFLASILSETDYPTTSIHGDRLQSQREKALADFKSGQMQVLIATAVAARGLDIKNVRHVINFDLPTSIDEYVHRIGRTGRVGNSGRATSFFDPDKDGPLAKELLHIIEGAGQNVPEFLRSHSGDFASGGNSGGIGKFGGRDVRRGTNKIEYDEQELERVLKDDVPQYLEDEEMWD